MQLSRKDYINEADNHYRMASYFVTALDAIPDHEAVSDEVFEKMMWDGLKAGAHLLMAHTAAQIAGAMKTVSG